eukprot:gb/GEZN01011143.1/.p1 GENE.gb/GEZN01011143.1/~~gb/GEZN01011143.1/.p1  ORF type:complete len:372 (+),score=69.66 gb/GEZN01011143.1/:26-1117(+)
MSGGTSGTISFAYTTVSAASKKPKRKKKPKAKIKARAAAAGEEAIQAGAGAFSTMASLGETPILLAGPGALQNPPPVIAAGLSFPSGAAALEERLLKLQQKKGGTGTARKPAKRPTSKRHVTLGTHHLTSKQIEADIKLDMSEGLWPRPGDQSLTHLVTDVDADTAEREAQEIRRKERAYNSLRPGSGNHRSLSSDEEGEENYEYISDKSRDREPVRGVEKEAGEWSSDSEGPPDATFVALEPEQEQEQDNNIEEQEGTNAEEPINIAPVEPHEKKSPLETPARKEGPKKEDVTSTEHDLDAMFTSFQNSQPLQLAEADDPFADSTGFEYHAMPPPPPSDSLRSEPSDKEAAPTNFCPWCSIL